MRSPRHSSMRSPWMRRRSSPLPALAVRTYQDGDAPGVGSFEPSRGLFHREAGLVQARIHLLRLRGVQEEFPAQHPRLVLTGGGGAVRPGVHGHVVVIAARGEE